jgi:hypothetical protein
MCFSRVLIGDRGVEKHYRIFPCMTFNLRRIYRLAIMNADRINLARIRRQTEDVSASQNAEEADLIISSQAEAGHLLTELRRLFLLS